MSKFELHVTLDLEEDQEDVANNIAILEGWKTSKIDGDPVLGSGIKFYFTKYEILLRNAEDSLYKIHSILVRNKLKVVRLKIEQIIYDKRFS